MSAILEINLAQPLTCVQALDACGQDSGANGPHNPDGQSAGHGPADPQAARNPQQELEDCKARFEQTNVALKGLITKLNEFYAGIFAEQREQIARLSVEIARRILAHRVEKADYKIEEVVKNALKGAPAREDLVVHLNPDDLANYEKIKRDVPSDLPAGLSFISDPGIGRAECLIESPQGIVESFTDAQLERVAKALVRIE